jgi:hypothetical protein
MRSLAYYREKNEVRTSLLTEMTSATHAHMHIYTSLLVSSRKEEKKNGDSLKEKHDRDLFNIKRSVTNILCF